MILNGIKNVLMNRVNKNSAMYTAKDKQCLVRSECNSLRLFNKRKCLSTCKWKQMETEVIMPAFTIVVYNEIKPYSANG